MGYRGGFCTETPKSTFFFHDVDTFFFFHDVDTLRVYVDFSAGF